MKIFILISIVILMTVSFMFSDHKVTYVSKTDGFYYGGVNNPEEISEQVLWIGDGKLAYITKAKRVVIDLEKNKTAIILTGTKKYIETELPFKMAGILPENLVTYLKNVQTSGKVKITAEEKKFEKFKCRIYESASHIMYQGNKVNEIDTNFWISEDVPFDLVQYEKMNKNLRVLRNYSPAFIAELEKLNGFPVYTESYFYPKGFGVKSTSKVSSIKKSDPPSDIYSIPAGFEKTDKLTMQEFRIR